MAGPREARSVESQSAEWHWSPDQTITAKLQVQARPSESEVGLCHITVRHPETVFREYKARVIREFEHMVLDSRCSS